jgi:deoxyhypusine synthase
MVSCGVRETIRFLVQHKYVDVLVTTAGGVEEDLIKCFAPTILGSFHLDGAELRQKGLNRIGNLLVPNDNYCRFEDWLLPILDEMVEQRNEIKWTPSSFIQRLGERIQDPSSIYYWAAKNEIPVFCPALTDGSIGDMLFFHTYRKPGLEIDIVDDIRRLNKIAIHAKKTGMIVLGGGVAKHHTFNANLMRNGADFSVLINTAQEYDGSDSGASPEEAISWGKIKSGGQPVKVFGDASILFPLLVSQTFAKDYWNKRSSK